MVYVPREVLSIVLKQRKLAMWNDKFKHKKFVPLIKVDNPYDEIVTNYIRRFTNAKYELRIVIMYIPSYEDPEKFYYYASSVMMYRKFHLLKIHCGGQTNIINVDEDGYAVNEDIINYYPNPHAPSNEIYFLT